MTCEEYKDLIAADIDQVLAPDEAAAARQHLAACTDCTELRRVQVEVRGLLRRHRSPSMDESLRTRVLAKLATLPAEPTNAPSEPHRPSPAKALRFPVGRRLVMVGAVAAALLLVLFPLGEPTRPELLSILVSDVRAAEAGAIPMGVETTDIGKLARYYAEQSELGFSRSVEDLSDMGLRPQGGTVRPLGAVPATFTVYEGNEGKVICRRFAAGAIEIPEGGEKAGDARLFTRDGVTIRIQRDGDAVCCLATTMPVDTFLVHMARGRHVHTY